MACDGSNSAFKLSSVNTKFREAAVSKVRMSSNDARRIEPQHQNFIDSQHYAHSKTTAKKPKQADGQNFAHSGTSIPPKPLTKALSIDDRHRLMRSSDV